MRAEIALHSHLPERYADEIHSGMQAFAYLVTRWADPTAIAFVHRLPLLHAKRHAEILEQTARRIALRIAIERQEAEWGHHVDLNGWRHAG